jgi:hypothetical protein
MDSLRRRTYTKLVLDRRDVSTPLVRLSPEPVFWVVLLITRGDVQVLSPYDVQEVMLSRYSYLIKRGHVVQVLLPYDKRCCPGSLILLKEVMLFRYSYLFTRGDVFQVLSPYYKR